MKIKSAWILFYTVTALLLPGIAESAEHKESRLEYFGSSVHYARETDIIFKKSDYVDYDTRQMRLFLGGSLKNPWHTEWEIVIGNDREHSDVMKKDGMLFGIQWGVLYDFFKYKKISLYSGVSAGLGYLRDAYGYDELADESPFFLVEGRLGLNYQFGKKYFLRAQTGIWHMSSMFQSDQGHNCWDYSIHLGYRF